MSNPYTPPQTDDKTRQKSPSHSGWSTFIAAFAAFCTYFCMYAFRKPFTAGTYVDPSDPELSFKSLFVLSQLCGYMLSKFIGVKVVSEMPAGRRAVTMVALMTIAELALFGFATLPLPGKVVMIFLNGLPLGMIFGLVLAYLEGRKHTEALAAGLCASFIVSSGVVKSVGRWLIDVQGISEYHMPALTGLIFFCPMLFFVWLLQRTPAPTEEDRQLRKERSVMRSTERMSFLRSYFPGLVALMLVYVALTVIRTIRDDFGVEIWRDLGVSDEPTIFAQSETVVAVFATALNACAILIVRNMTAFTATLVSMAIGFFLVLGSVAGQWSGQLSPFVFMVACGVGLYIPYVAFHTTVFERLISISRRPANLGFLMYVADATGYLGYAGLMVWKTVAPAQEEVLPFFRGALILTSTGCTVLLLMALRYFRVVFRKETGSEDDSSLNSAPVTAGGSE